jgi:hypothetical protein
VGAVSSFATRRLIDAAATLDPPERALVNLWVNQGLDDAEVARMTGMSHSVIAERRTRIVEHLSDELGLPPEDIRNALNKIVPALEDASTELEAPSGNGSAVAGAEAAPDFETAEEAATEPEAPAEAQAPEEAPKEASTDTIARSSSRRRPLLWAALTLVVLVVLIVVLTSGGSSRHQRPAATSTRSVATAPAVSTGQSPPRTSTSAPLLGVPGGPAHATGTVAVSRNGSTVKLDLSVRNLPPATHGHYEVWLYDSLIYSEDLGRLRGAATHVSLRIPADAGRYHWIDVSFQPVGRVFHSGESFLRSANPLFGKATPSSP